MKSLMKAILFLTVFLIAWLTPWVQAGLTLNEFLVVNIDGPLDKDDDLSPWVEIHNSSDSAENLIGWFLTDDPEDLTQWSIPRKTIPNNGHELLHLSGKDHSSLFSTEVHANFKLSDSDSYLALVRPDGITIASEISEIPKQRIGVSYGFTETGEPSYFSSPTPRASNQAPIAGFVSDTK
ncbi:MAG: hypothetical protein ACKVHP_24580, partial [Verrucomicrobiales bacterium]